MMKNNVGKTPQNKDIVNFNKSLKYLEKIMKQPLEKQPFLLYSTLKGYIGSPYFFIKDDKVSDEFLNLKINKEYKELEKISIKANESLKISNEQYLKDTIEQYRKNIYEPMIDTFNSFLLYFKNTANNTLDKVNHKGVDYNNDDQNLTTLKKGENDYITIDRKFIDIFTNFYGEVEFRLNNAENPVGIVKKENGELLGAIMPLKNHINDFDFNQLKKENEK